MFSAFQEKIGYLESHRFVRQTAVLQGGTMVGNIFQALVGVFLARLLQPERFGIYALAMSLASLLSIALASGTQDAAASLLGASYAQNDRHEIKEILAFYLKLTIYTILISLAGIFLAPLVTGYFYHNSNIGWYAGFVIAAAVLSSSVFSLAVMTLQVAGEIPKMMALSVTDQVLRWTLSLIFVYLGYGIIGAVAGQFIGSAVIFFISFWAWEWLKKNYSLFPSIRSLFSNFSRVPVKKYLGFSLWIALDRNLGTLYMILPVLLAGVYISIREVTYFKLAFGYINLALSALGPISVLLNVEFPKMRVENQSKLARNFMKISFYSILLSTLITTVMVAVSPFLFRLLYGESFLPSITYIGGLFVYGALFGIGVGLGPMWRAVHRVKTSILINTIILGIGIPAGLVLIKQFGLWGAVVSVTLWFTVSHFVSFFYLANFLKRREATYV